MTQTVFGIALDAVGSATDGRSRYWSTPSQLLRSIQDPTVAVTLEHGHEIGKVIFINRARGGNVWVVGEISDDVRPEAYARVGTELRSVPVPFFWSVGRIGGPDLGYVLTEVALTAATARVTARPVEFRSGSVSQAAYTESDSHARRLLKKASEYHTRRRLAEPLYVVDDDPALLDAAPTQYASSRSAPVEIRSDVEVRDVSSSQRLIEAIVMPWETPTVVHHHGRVVREIIARGAFDTIPRDGGRVKVNRDHDASRPVGRAVAFNPGHADGLWTRMRIADTDAGNETLTLAEEGILDLSAGFGVHDGGESWPAKDVRLLTDLHLDHIGMVSNPAYPTAQVLNVARSRELAGV